MGDELSREQAQNGVNFDFEVKFDLEGQGQSPPKTIGILTKVFYTYGPNLVILAWTGDELSRGQTWWRTDWRTDGRTQATTIPEGQYWPRVKTKGIYIAHVGWGPLTPMVPVHLSISLITGRGTGTVTCGIGSVFPPNDLWIGLDTYMDCILIYDLLLQVWLIGCATCFIYIDWWGKGWPMVAWPFWVLVVLYRILPIFTKYEMFNVLLTVYTIVHIPRMFLPSDSLF